MFAAVTVELAPPSAPAPPPHPCISIAAASAPTLALHGPVAKPDRIDCLLIRSPYIKVFGQASLNMAWPDMYGTAKNVKAVGEFNNVSHHRRPLARPDPPIRARPPSRGRSSNILGKSRFCSSILLGHENRT
jgi:hypothetical protein